MPSWNRMLLVLLSVNALGLLFYTAGRRLFYPFELEWIEGAMAQHVARVLQGKPLYDIPSLDFTANLYTPLFYYLSAAVAALRGLDFASLRLVSLVATLLTLCLLAAFVYRETRSALAALVAVALYAATYAASGSWMDIGRVDALYVMFLMAAVYVLRDLRHTGHAIAVVILLLLAYLSKQSALIAAVCLCAYPLVCKPQHLHRTTLLLLLMVTMAGLWWTGDYLTGGWFSYYTFRVPQGHPTNMAAVSEFLVYDLCLAVPFALGMSAFFLWRQFRQQHDHRWYFLFVFVALATVATATRINQGGYSNNTMPLYLACAIGFALFLHELWQEQAITRRYYIISGLALLQFLVLLYNPANRIPGAADRQAYEKVLQKIQALPGNVYAYESGFLGTLAGKRDFTHGTAFYDLRLSSNKDSRFLDIPAYPADPLLLPELERYQVKAIILSERQRNVGREPKPTLGPFVFKEHLLPDAPDAMWPKSGAAIRPALLYVRE